MSKIKVKARGKAVKALFYLNDDLPIAVRQLICTKHRLRHILILTLLLATGGSGLVLAQAKKSIQNLANGDYFYGESVNPYRSGTRYLMFRKTGSTITGRDYIERSSDGDWVCFQGTANNNTITNVTIAIKPIAEDTKDPAWEYYSGQPINVTTFSQLYFDQASNSTVEAWQSCLQVFGRRPLK